MDNHSPRRVLFALGLFLSCSAQMARAQSTDGYHGIQVLPVVVDTASFTQRFHFRASYSWDPAEITVTFYPAEGTAQAGPLACTTFYTSFVGEVSFSSLRDLCPGLVPGSAFGSLIARNAAGVAFTVSSRVNNSAGSGFAVEAFPASDFTTATTSVTGLRRMAAQAGSPAYQSNCFVGRLAELAPVGSPVANKVTLSVTTKTGLFLGKTDLMVMPGQLIRLLDVFAAVGFPTGNYDDAVASFETLDETGAGLVTFCTVQDNTSFGADFRIGKQEMAWYGSIPGAQDESAKRWNRSLREEPIDDQTAGAAFAIPAGASRNVHLIFFRHPDVIGCAVTDESGMELGDGYGVEMRMRILDSDGWNVLAGGNGSTGFYNLYLGDKPRHGVGANTSYQIEVESNGLNEGANRPYQLACTSGSGHTPAILIRKGLPVTF